MLKLILLSALAAIATGRPLEETVQQIRGIECDLCDEAIDGIASLLKSDESTLVGYLDDICKILPSSDNGECQDLIKQFGPQIIDYLISELQSKPSGCSDTSICNSVLSCGCSGFTKDVVQPQVDICEVCKDVLGELDSILNNPTDQSAIEQEIEKLCPSSISSLCDSIIGTEGSKLLDWVAKELDPTTVCSAIDAC